MRTIIAALLMTPIGCAARPSHVGTYAPVTAHCKVNGALPDASCTPGAVETTDLKITCGQRSSERRNVTESTKRKVLAMYGMSRWESGPLEIDHRVPICAGGAETVENLWPELASPVPGFPREGQA